MSKKKKKIKIESDGMVYSTNPGFSLGDLLQGSLGKGKSSKTLEAHLEKKGRGGKTAIIIKGFDGSENELKGLAKSIKNHCGVGGSAKDGEIIIQGDIREKIIKFLESKSYNVKRVGG